MVDALYIKLLQQKSGVPLNQSDAGAEFASLYDTEFMAYLLEEASLRHNRKPFRDNRSELPAIFLLARIEVYTILAGAFAKNYDIGSKDGKLTKSQPFEHYNKLIKELTKTYSDLGGATSARPTPVLLTNKTRHMYRNYMNAPEPTIDIQIVSVTDLEVQFKVTPLSSVAVTKLDIYLSPDNIYDLVEVGNINPTSTLVDSVPYTTNTYRVTKTLESKYLGIVAKNKYGKQYILEVSLESPVTPPQDSGAIA